ncbi:MAG: bifunctional diaminohydroxyphosphoribosylaminopyrimidine deaminase/5-amino-6-(5-phosphoribosylamino)uracil reductase RibD, partial [Candidatus Omnitrophica bacterium]|nr:bifunctional diaminohydroxyphosphoribosylaminopyrimidine deaminase/5-amino-6-(5-phosphoribosylamino)uracil reductase RibD [Candidatus Omnitrophota bacterium]
MNWLKGLKMPDDKFYMRLALVLAQKGRGGTSPNPMVGAVIVKNNKIVGLAYHKEAGGPHAEAAALKEAGKSAKGAALYINLEPCAHFGRTPPCTQAIIKSGIKKVIAAMKDPNPIIAGRGFVRLKKNGIKVAAGTLEDEAKILNEVFIKYITKKMPFVIVKAAQSLDGKIAAKTGDSKWITSEESRRYVHRLRSQVDAVMVGAGTVVKDDPLLTSRVSEKQPVKVIVDSELKISHSAKIFSKESPAKVILATTAKATKNRIEKFRNIGAEVLVLKKKNSMVGLRQLMKELAKREITSILVEGGGELIGSLVDEKLVDKFSIFIAPKIIGGKEAITSV